MKNFPVIAIAGAIVLAGGVFVAGGLGLASAASDRSAGAINPTQQASATERTVTLQVDNMYCAACPYIVKQSLAAVPGVKNVSVSFRDKAAIVTFDSARTNARALTDATFNAGYPSEVKKP